MYTLKDLQDKNLKELKEIGWQINVLPDGDKRHRQNWIDALAGVNPPLLELLEVSPGAEVEPVAEPIEVQAQEPIDSKFGRIVYPKLAPEPIAPAGKTSPGVENCTEADRPPNRGDNGRGRLESEPKVSQSAMAFRSASYGSCAPPVTFSPRFLATYAPYFGEIHYKAEATGQLNLLEPETDDEPPDPDDFASIDAFREAIALWDAENPEPLTVSMASMCEWAPCPDEWYEPEAENLPLKASSMRELSPLAIESSSTFSIPTFDAWCDRANRQNDKDEPPDTGNFARLPGPKPPKFPPRAIGESHDSDISSTPKQAYCITYCIAVSSSSPSGRSPPGGDAHVG